MLDPETFMQIVAAFLLANLLTVALVWAFTQINRIEAKGETPALVYYVTILAAFAFAGGGLYLAMS